VSGAGSRESIVLDTESRTDFRQAEKGVSGLNAETSLIDCGGVVGRAVMELSCLVVEDVRTDIGLEMVTILGLPGSVMYI
jgi:hypothetical protein